MPVTLYIRSIADAPAARAEVRANQQIIGCRSRDIHLAAISLDSRLYEEDSARLLHKLQALPEAQRGQIEVVDVGTFTGWFKGWQAGVRSTPAVIKDGMIYAGVAEAEQALEE